MLLNIAGNINTSLLYVHESLRLCVLFIYLLPVLVFSFLPWSVVIDV